VKNKNIRSLILIAIYSLILAVCDTPAGQSKYQIEIIVHPGNPIQIISRAQLVKLFLKKQKYWSSGIEVQPVNMEDKTELFSVFLRDYINKSKRANRAYWQKQIFSGRSVPPASRETEFEICQYVEKNPGAIAYISSSFAQKCKNVKIVKVQD
jgi:ABC-type phosphate transport system substrate-binding protein